MTLLQHYEVKRNSGQDKKNFFMHYF